MLEKLRKVKLQLAGMVYIGMILIGMLVHALVITESMPYDWINGGRIADYDVAYQISIVAIITLSFSVIITLFASRIIPIIFSGFWNVLIKIYIWIQTVYMGISIVLQLLGTPFERYFLSIVVLIAFVASLRIAIEKR